MNQQCIDLTFLHWTMHFCLRLMAKVDEVRLRESSSSLLGIRGYLRCGSLDGGKIDEIAQKSQNKSGKTPKIALEPTKSTGF